MQPVLETTALEGVLLLRLRAFHDARGRFQEIFRQEWLEQLGIDTQLVQDNLSYSAPGTLRGLHYQSPPHAQAKIIQALTGTVQDVVVDIRPQSPTYGRHLSYILSGDEPTALYLPEGIAHGFCVPRDQKHGAWVLYKCSAYYHQSSESGIRWDDPALAIQWAVKDPIVSEKDASLPMLSRAMHG